MEKWKLVVGIVMLSYAVGAVYGPGSGSNVFCTDSATKDDIYTKGRISGNDGTNSYDIPDQCKDANVLLKYFCSGSAKASKEVSCTFGCADGACSKTAPALPESASMGTIDVSSVPPGADVFYFVGKLQTKAGKTPLKVQVQPGRIMLKISLAGYAEYLQEIQIGAGETRNIVVQLKVAPTPSPSVTPASPTTPGEYKCEFSTLKERVKCRLGLSDNEQTRQIPFVPEECRVQEEPNRGECVALYAKLNICNHGQNDNQRGECAERVLQVGGDIAAEKQKCDGMAGNDKISCNNELRKKTYALVKFRFYNLEEKAEKLGRMGVNELLVVDLIANLELRKQKFNEAGNNEQRKQIIFDVKKLWTDFKRDAVAQLTASAKAGAQ